MSLGAASKPPASAANLRQTRSDEGGESGEGLSSRDSATTEVAKELWTALMQTIAVRLTQLGGAEQAEPGAEGAERRASDGKLTFGSATFDGTGAAAGAETGDALDAGGAPEAPGQMHLELDGGRLGTVYLTVQRQGTAISVVVGVADPIQRALVELELSSLTHALKAAGLNVGSVRVLHPEAAGTAFAQGKRGMTFQSIESASSAYRSFRSRQQVDAEEGLDVVG